MKQPYDFKILAGKLAVALIAGLILAFIVPVCAPLSGQAGLISTLFVAAVVSLVNDIQTWLKSQSEPPKAGE